MLSPAHFARLGLAILGLAVAFAVWTGDVAPAGFGRLVLGAVAGFAVAGVGEWVFRRLASEAERRADLEERTSLER